VTRDELIARTRQLIDEGERIQASPSMPALQLWLQLSDDLLASAWGLMDRYHLAWLMVGKPADTVRGRAMTPDEEASYVREVAQQKTAALRMSLDAVERQGMPFHGEDGGVGAGQGMGSVPASQGQPASDRSSSEPAPVDEPAPGDPVSDHRAVGSQRVIPLDPALEARLAEARRRANEHRDHDAPRAPRPERLQR
jgi:hypothetical protein